MHISSHMMLPVAEEGVETAVVGKLPALNVQQVEPIGRWFEAYCHRQRNKKTLSYHSLKSSSSEEEEEDDDIEDEEDERLLRTLDPREWKNQDHYAVIGLANMRYKATDDQIKRAYKKKVLRHHPDKRRARGLPVKDGDDDYFTCITRAWEILGNTSKRRSYDSVDPQFDDTIPSAGPEAKENFIEIFASVFERNARWSNKKNVPLLGDDDSTYDDVNHFYSFWYDFDSWREYSYLDEEEKEKGENREERRWIEKQNKAARQKRKKEEVARIRQLVDNAYNCDPRIAKFKEAEKARKQAQKQAKKDAARARHEEEERVRKEAEEAERLKKEQEEAEAKEKAASLKKEKEAQKKAMKKERKTLRGTVKDYDYFASNETERIQNLADVDRLAELLSLVSLQDLNKLITCGDKERARVAFLKEVEDMNARLEKEKQEQLMAAMSKSTSSSDGSHKLQWSEEETTMLIKAVNLFPAGTVARWETVANFITQHIPESKRSAKEVLNKVKDMQKMNPTLKNEVNQKAFDRFEKQMKTPGSAEKAEISTRTETVAEQQISTVGSNPAPWTAEEQKLLEQSLRTFPASTPQRWDKIAEVIPSRSKKDCMKRYKELVELVQAKKAASAATAKGKK